MGCVTTLNELGSDDPLLPLIDLMVLGFLDDPLYAWLYPEPTDRHDALRSTFGLMLEGGRRNGRVTVSDDRSALAIWTAPGCELLDEPAMQSFLSALRTRLGDRAADALEGMAACAALAPPAPHATVHSIVVHPDSRGCGVGNGLLESVLQSCDNSGWTVALDSSNPRNLHFYQRAGFRIAGEVQLPGGGPPMWAMHRRAET